MIDHTYRDARFTHKSAFDAFPENRRTCVNGNAITASPYTLTSKVKGLCLSCDCGVTLKVNLSHFFTCVDALADFFDAHTQQTRVKRRMLELVIVPESVVPVIESVVPVLESVVPEPESVPLWSVYTGEKEILELEIDFDFDVEEVLSLGDTFAIELARQNRAEDLP